MKRLKRVKRRIAAVMSVVLLAGAVTFPAAAEETKKWVLEDDGSWYFYRNGELVTDDETKIGGVFYAFDEGGRMYCDELFVSPKEEDEDGLENRYAYPDGRLATGWVKLNEEDNTLYDGEGEYNWYYFKENARGVGEMVKNREITIEKDGTFAFDEYGHMYSETWLPVDQDGKILTDEMITGDNAAYYQKDGFRAQGKKLLLGNDKDAEKEYWYAFKDDGTIDNIVGIASPANADPIVSDIVVASPGDADHRAPARRVQSVDIAGDPEEIVFVPGKNVELKFAVELKDESYPVKNDKLTKNHDMWISETATGVGSVKIKVTDPEKGIVTVSCVPKQSKPMELALFVDGVKSESAYQLIPKKSDELTQAEQAGVVETMLGDAAGMAPSVTKDAIIEIYANAKEEDKAALQDTLLNNSNYETLSSMYAVKYGIRETVEPAEEVEELLDTSKISFVGGALNIYVEDTGFNQAAALKVDKGDESDLTQNYAYKAAFEITMLLGDAGNEEETEKLALPVQITLPVPNGYDVSKVKLFHIVDGKEVEVDCRRNSENNTITFMTDSFSPFVFAQNEALDLDDDDDGNDGNDGNGSYDSDDSDDGYSYDSGKSAGQWILDNIGWWYKNSDGSYPADKWMYLQYNGQYNWYHFNKDGYMDAGWFMDTDGKTYYLNPKSDGSKGAMMTGWQQIDGGWYYFNTVSNGYKGSMFINGTTPDGYKVNEKGQRVQ